MTTSEIEIVEGGNYDGTIMAISHYGTYPECIYLLKTPKPLALYYKCDPCLDDININIEKIEYINSGKMHNGRWIFVRKK